MCTAWHVAMTPMAQIPQGTATMGTGLLSVIPRATDLLLGTAPVAKHPLEVDVMGKLNQGPHHTQQTVSPQASGKTNVL